jgi:two-component system CheB/CheR fusion protein
VVARARFATEPELARRNTTGAGGSGDSELRNQRLRRLETELRLTKARLQASMEALESSKAELRDVAAERERDQERQRLLIAELQHRVKNILSVVRSITTRTLLSSDRLDDFAAHFDGRLRALARIQAVLARQPEAEVELDEIVHEELLSHATHEGRQVEVHGPRVRLRQKAAETFALALHELATNAMKYGALSSPAGRVTIGWRVTSSEAGPMLVFEWRETGVAVVNRTPARIGFGRELIEQGLPGDLPGAATSFSFGPGGLQCMVELPMNQYAAQPLQQQAEQAGPGRASVNGR